VLTELLVGVFPKRSERSHKENGRKSE